MHKRTFCAALAAAAAVLCLALPARATVTSLCSPASYSGNSSTTVFTFACRFLASSDLVVTVTDATGSISTKVLNTDYTVSGAGSTSGTVTFTAAPATGTTVKITRSVDYLQPLSIRNSRLLDTPSIENEIDKLAMGEQQLSQGIGVIGGDASGASVLVSGTTTARTLAAALASLPIPAKAYNAACDSSADDASKIQSCITNNTQCLLPAGTCAIASGLTIPSYHKLIGVGHGISILKYTGSGCAVTVDGADSGGMSDLKIWTPNTAKNVRGICQTNATGNTLRNRFRDVWVLGAQSPPTAGAYCVYIHSTTGNSNYLSIYDGLITQNCDRGVELLGDVGSGGANANWFPQYSSNGTVTGIYFDGLAGDNYVQGHCNGSGTTFAQTCVVQAGGVTSGGNEWHMVSDQGDHISTGQDFSIAAGTVNDLIFSVNESILPGQSAADSSNFIFATKALQTTARSFYAPSSFLSGTTSLSGDIFAGAAQRNTSVLVKANQDYTIGSHDRNVCSSSSAAPHIFTLGANTGQKLTICDSDGTITGVNTLTIAPPATGRVNGSTSGVILNAAWKSAQCEAPTQNGLIWSCTVSP